jgi:hypothetical protein
LTAGRNGVATKYQRLLHQNHSKIAAIHSKTATNPAPKSQFGDQIAVQSSVAI